INFIPSDISPRKILDFGGGNGELSLRLIKKYSNCQTVCYEPSPSMLKEAENKISGSSNITLTETTELLPDQSFEIVFRLEDYEHLPENESATAIATINKLVKKNGLIIIGVPNEIYLAALYKGIFRMSRRYGEYDAQ